MKSFSANRSKPFIFPLNFVKVNNRYEGKGRVKDEAMLEADQTTPNPSYSGGEFLLLFKLEGILDAGEFCLESQIHFQALLDGIAAVDNRRVVAVADELSDATGGHLRIFLSQIHRHLTHLHKVAFAALAEHLTLLDIVVTAHLLEDLVNSERMVIYLDGTLDDALGQTHIDIRSFSNILDDVGRNLQTVATTLGTENIFTKLHIRFFQFGNQSTGETGEQTVLHALKVHRRSVGCQNNLAPHTEKMVEDMEERVKRLGGVHPLLDVIDDQHIDGLVEVDEVVGGVMTHRVGELHLEQTGRDIEHPFLGIGLLAAHADGVDQVCLATTRGTVDKEGIERALARMLGDGEADGTWKFVGIALDEVLEGLLRVELGIQLLGRSGIECRWRLVGALRLLDLRRTIALHSSVSRWFQTHVRVPYLTVPRSTAPSTRTRTDSEPAPRASAPSRSTTRRRLARTTFYTAAQRHWPRSDEGILPKAPCDCYSLGDHLFFLKFALKQDLGLCL